MAENDYSVKFGQQQLLIESDPGSGFFTAPCGITGLTRSINTNTNDIDLPPCDDPDAFVWLGVDVVSRRMQLTFQGTLADRAMPTWDSWSMEDIFRTVRWYRNIGEANQGYWEGQAVLSEYTETSESRGRYTNSGTIIFDGQPTWYSIPPAPGNTELPEITGDVEVTGLLAVSNGAWTGTPTFTYQWRRNGVDIIGANASGYTLVAADEGASISALVTGTNVSGSLTVLAPAVGPVEPAP